MKSEKLDNLTVDKEVAMKEIIQSLVDLERNSLCLLTEKRLLMNTNEEILSFLLNTATRGS